MGVTDGLPATPARRRLKHTSIASEVRDDVPVAAAASSALVSRAVSV